MAVGYLFDGENYLIINNPYQIAYRFLGFDYDISIEFIPYQTSSSEVKFLMVEREVSSYPIDIFIDTNKKISFYVRNSDLVEFGSSSLNEVMIGKLNRVRVWIDQENRKAYISLNGVTNSTDIPENFDFSKINPSYWTRIAYGNFVGIMKRIIFKKYSTQEEVVRFDYTQNRIDDIKGNIPLDAISVSGKYYNFVGTDKNGRYVWLNGGSSIELNKKVYSDLNGKKEMSIYCDFEVLDKISPYPRVIGNGFRGYIYGINSSGMSFVFKVDSSSGHAYPSWDIGKKRNKVLVTINTETGDVVAYINGKKTVRNYGNLGTLSPYNERVRIGNTSGMFRYMNGRIYDVKVWDRVLSDDEYKQLLSGQDVSSGKLFDLWDELINNQPNSWEGKPEITYYSLLSPRQGAVLDHYSRWFKYEGYRLEPPYTVLFEFTNLDIPNAYRNFLFIVDADNQTTRYIQFYTRPYTNYKYGIYIRSFDENNAWTPTLKNFGKETFLLAVNNNGKAFVNIGYYKSYGNINVSTIDNAKILVNYHTSPMSLIANQVKIVKGFYKDISIVKDITDRDKLIFWVDYRTGSPYDIATGKAPVFSSYIVPYVGVR